MLLDIEIPSTPADREPQKEGGRDYLLVATALQVIGKSHANSSMFMNAGAVIKAEHEQSYAMGPSGSRWVP